jgi:hypothetical protein
MQTLIIPAFFCLLAASAASAQRRHPLIGSVVNANGEAVAGAEVTLLEDDPSLIGIDPIDICVAKTDDRGRFVASALVGVRYTAVAWTPEANGEALVAPPVPDQRCGNVCSMVAKLHGRRRQIALPLAPALRAVGGLHVRMGFRGASGHYVVIPITDQGIEVPPCEVVGYFTLHASDGAFLGNVGVPDVGDDVALVTSPLSLTARVVDADGAPVAGAKVTVHDGSTGSILAGMSALADADGRAVLLWGGWNDPFEQAPQTMFVTATAAGFQEGASGWVCKQPFVGFETKKRHRRQVIVVPLTKVNATPRGSVDPAFGGCRARVDVMGNVREAPGRHYFLPRTYEVTIAPDGAYELPQLPPSASTVRIHLPPRDGRRTELLTTTAPVLPSAAPSDCDMVAGQVIDQAGGPASGAEVVLAGHTWGTTVRVLVPDAAGRFDRILQRGRWTLLAMDATGWASRELDGAIEEPLAMRLEAKPQRRVRVVDGEGRGVAGASFEPGDFPYGFSGRTGLDSLLVDLGWNTFADHIRRARTDERGEATLYFLPWPGVAPAAFAYVGDYSRRSDDVVIATGDEILSFQLRHP